jgi:hypothetical protein
MRSTARPESFYARHLDLSACLLAILAVWQPPGVRGTAAAPMLTLEPDRGPCNFPNPQTMVRGKDFPPEIAIVIHAGRIRDGLVIPTIARAVIADDGTFAVAVPLRGVCYPNESDGSQFAIIAAEDVTPSRGGPPLASAIFSVGSSASSSPALPNTGGGGGQVQAVWPSGLLAAEAAPALTLEPARGRCATDNPLVVARGTGFPPGATVYFSVVRDRDNLITAESSAKYGFRDVVPASRSGRHSTSVHRNGLATVKGQGQVPSSRWTGQPRPLRHCRAAAGAAGHHRGCDRANNSPWSRFSPSWAASPYVASGVDARAGKHGGRVHSILSPRQLGGVGPSGHPAMPLRVARRTCM